MVPKATEPQGHLDPPLSPAVFHILLALAAGEMHGYAIMQEIAILSDGRVSVGPGTLYGSIKKLLAAGLIEESAERPDPKLDDERRRYYRLTGDGSKVLASEADRLSRLVRAARARKVMRRAPVLEVGDA
jgi:DNA-binding PadR family transcriptional regulator